MLFLMPCATIKDNVTLLPIGQVSKLAVDMDKARKEIKNLSNQQHLIGQVKNGATIMMKKIIFDNYLKSQVELMKAYVINKSPTPFTYDGYYSQLPIKTQNLTIKEQWAMQIILTRLNICSIYQLGAYSSLQQLFKQTVDTFNANYKESDKFLNHLQVIYRYFYEGYEPLLRISHVFDSIQKLLSPSAKQILQFKKQLFFIMKSLMEVNLAMLKIEKFRILCEYKKCKQAGYAIFFKLMQIKSQLSHYPSINPAILGFVNIGYIFFRIYSLYFLIEENEHLKLNEDYGFVKKEFQPMILDNLAVVGELQKLSQKFKNIPNIQNIDCGSIGIAIVDKIMEKVAKFKYKFSITLHQTKATVPSIEEVLVRRIQSTNICQRINQF